MKARGGPPVGGHHRSSRESANRIGQEFAVRFKAATTPLILDGAMGTELARRGVPMPSPLWSAAALLTHPHVIEEIHTDYVAAGADILVANTFRTNPRTLARAGVADRGGELTSQAVRLARKAVEKGEWRVFVAASVGPVEDCYSPELTPPDDELRREHEMFARQVKAAEPDLVWIETMGTVREAAIAVEAAAGAGLDFAVSFVTREDGALLGGESLQTAVDRLLPWRPVAIGLNCGPPTGITNNLSLLVRAIRNNPAAKESGLPQVAAYAHIANATPLPGWSFAETPDPSAYLAMSRTWIEHGATIVGGCCGTRPYHIAELVRGLRRTNCP